MGLVLRRRAARDAITEIEIVRDPRTLPAQSGVIAVRARSLLGKSDVVNGVVPTAVRREGHYRTRGSHQGTHGYQLDYGITFHILFCCVSASGHRLGRRNW